MINKERLLERFLTYVQLDSPTRKEKEFAIYLMKEMQSFGMVVEMDNAGEMVGSNCGNLIGRLKGHTQGEPILFSAHLDTVSPGEGIKPMVKDGIITSDGTTILGGDDKSGIAAILEALETLVDHEIPHGDIEVLFSIVEEDGLHGSKNLDYSKIAAKNAFILDSGGDVGTAIVQAPAQKKITATFLGKSAHAGVSPEDGISAISIAAEAISHMNLLRIDDETTANIGMIHGGEATNIVAESTTIIAESRSRDDAKLDKQVKHMVECCEKAAEKFHGRVDVHVDHTYSSFVTDENSAIVGKFKEACAAIGAEPFLTSSGGGSDANILSGKGLSVINLATGMSQVHTVEEFIALEDLEKTAALVVEIVKTYA